ncbi:MAG: DUF2336 domain-containing protein [Anderseniella sp.]|uniref:DUF2336 domain-containing protein n=1 Tax=Parasphingorhabdus sp. TaxID=2709688 RepID=UPI00326BEC3E
MSFDGDIQAAGGVQPNEGLIAATLLHCNPARVIPQVDELPSAANSLVDRLLTSVTSLKLAENVVSILVETPEADEEAVEAAEADQAAEADEAAETAEVSTGKTAAKGTKGKKAAPDKQALEDASRDLVAIMILPSGQAQPQERFFAGDALLGIMPHLPPADLTSLARTVARLDVVSERLRTFLVTHSDNDISCRMLKDAHYISDVDLLKVIPTGSEQQLRLIARRRLLNVVVCDAIIEAGNAPAILELLRNSESQLSTSAFIKLMPIVVGNNDLESALCNRKDLPQAVGLEMFWQGGQNLRRYLLTRFLTESAALGRVMSIGMKVDAIPSFGSKPSADDIEELISQIENGDPKAAETLASYCRIDPETAKRVVNDAGGEPITVVFKCLAQSRLVMAQALQRWVESDKCPINGENRIVELHAQFDGMSFNKARMLLSYWDWASRESGPFRA